MTKNLLRTRRTRVLRMPLPSEVCFAFFTAFCLLLLLKNSEAAIEYMNRGLRLCAKSIVPSLFPFMVLSEFLVNGEIAKRIPKFIIKPFQKIFGLPADACLAILLGMICGFPVGAKCIALAYRKGALNREEAERALCCSNNPSSAFLISAVGTSLWGNRQFGTALYVTVLTVSLLTGIFQNLISTKKEEKAIPSPQSAQPIASTPRRQVARFTASVRSATESMLLVCAYVIFFSTLVGTLQLILGQFSLTAEWQASIFSLFELSSGMSYAATLGNTALAALLCAFAAGWSGLSVHCQVMSVCDDCNLSFRRYFLSKLLQGLLCALLFGLLIRLFPNLTVAQGCETVKTFST